MLNQLNIYGRNMVEQAVERLRKYEPAEGYFLAFSGGKDSVTIKALADMAGVKYTAHYSVTSVDPPELVQFVKTFDDVVMDFPRYKNWGGGDDVESDPEKETSTDAFVPLLLRIFQRE